jgi:hypothetical protein
MFFPIEIYLLSWGDLKNIKRVNKRKMLNESVTVNIICEIKNELTDTPKKDIGIRNDYYVYHLIDPKTSLPFYVGKGRIERMFDHEKAVLNERIPNNNKLLFYKIKKILKEFGSIKYSKILENVNDNDALEKEMFEIKKYGRRDNKTGILCNLTDGGETFHGFKQSKEQIKNRMEKLKLWRYSLTEEKKMEIRNRKSKKIKMYWDTHPAEKETHIKMLKEKCWRYGKNHHCYGKNKGKENPSYKSIPIDVERKIIELHNNGFGKRKIVKEIFNVFGIELEENKPLNILRFNGIQSRSIEEINEIKRKKIPELYQNLIKKLFVVDKMGIVNISKRLSEENIQYSPSSVRRFLQRNKIYVKGQYSGK